MHGKPTCLKELGSTDSQSYDLRHSTSLPIVVCTVDEGLGKDTFFIIASLVFWILRMPFDKLVLGGRFSPINTNAVEDVKVNTEFQLPLEIFIIRFPDDYLQIRSVKIDVADEHVLVRDEKLSDVREDQFAILFSNSFTTSSRIWIRRKA
jgi:hypothetical protein